MKREPFRHCPRIRRGANLLIGAAFCLLVPVFGGVAQAQLSWETRSLEFHPSLTDKQVVAEYHFTNTGKKAVKITDIGVSCGCTSATADKNPVYEPGAKGTITAIYDIGGRSGVQKESVYVRTNDASESEVTLQLNVTIPKLLDLDKVFLAWKSGEALNPKTVNVKLLGDYPVRDLAVSTTSPGVSAQLKHAAGTRDYQLVITPKIPDSEFVIVEIKPDYPKNPPKLYHVYVSVGR